MKGRTSHDAFHAAQHQPAPPYIIEVVTAYPERRFLRSFDPDGNDGIGFIKCTEDPREALQFGSWAEVEAFRDQQSNVRPFWPDGEPNRPLRALTLDIVKMLDG